MNRRLSAILALAIVVLGSHACAPPAVEAPPGPHDIRPAELLPLLEESDAPVLVDVRTAKEFDEGHIQTALNISHELFPARLRELDQYKRDWIVLYCRSGRRAKIVQKQMVESGFEKVGLLPGDMIEWKQKGYPLERSQAKTGE